MAQHKRIVGAGFGGLAAARGLVGAPVDVTLIDLSPFQPRQSRQALHALADLGVDVRLGASVNGIDDHGVVRNGERIAAANVIWCAGTRARDAASWLGARTAGNGAVVVEPDCSIPGHPSVFVIGDGASYRTADGKTLPGLAPVVEQQKRYVAQVTRGHVSGTADPATFRYRNWGMTAVIGRSHAVADFGWLRIGGIAAWLLWSMVHLFLLIDFRSRSSVYLAWSYARFTRDHIARLLTRKAIPDFRVPSKLEPSPMSWIYLVLAGLFEIGWPVGLKMAQTPATRVGGNWSRSFSWRSAARCCGSRNGRSRSAPPTPYGPGLGLRARSSWES